MVCGRRVSTINTSIHKFIYYYFLFYMHFKWYNFIKQIYYIAL